MFDQLLSDKNLKRDGFYSSPWLMLVNNTLTILNTLMINSSIRVKVLNNRLLRLNGIMIDTYKVLCVKSTCSQEKNFVCITKERHFRVLFCMLLNCA